MNTFTARTVAWGRGSRPRGRRPAARRHPLARGARPRPAARRPALAQEASDRTTSYHHPDGVGEEAWRERPERTAPRSSRETPTAAWGSAPDFAIPNPTNGWPYVAVLHDPFGWPRAPVKLPTTPV